MSATDSCSICGRGYPRTLATLKQRCPSCGASYAVRACPACSQMLRHVPPVERWCARCWDAVTRATAPPPETADQEVRVRLTPTQLRALHGVASEYRMSPSEVAERILTTWLDVDSAALRAHAARMAQPPIYPTGDWQRLPLV